MPLRDAVKPTDEDEEARLPGNLLTPTAKYAVRRAGKTLFRPARRDRHDNAIRFAVAGAACLALLLGPLALTSCSALSNYNFLQPGKDWRTRSGQLQYRNNKNTVTGDVVVRTSKRGDFEMTFAKGPGVTLLTIQQDEHNAQVKGPMARLAWSGPVERAPKQLRGWLSLREKLLQSQDQSVVTQKIGSETFSFRF